MNFRPKTVRRLLILLAAVLVVVGTAAAFYWRNERARTARLMAARQSGMTAFKADDYRAALDSLKIYVARDIGKKDTEALYAYGVSRARIEEPSGKHVLEGITVFKTVLQLDPGHLEAKHRLLELYPQARYNTDTIDLADRVLSQDPADMIALRAKCVALEQQRKFEAALAASEKINEQQPTDLDQQFTTYRLMMALKRPAADLLARAQRAQKSHPDDPRFSMLLAMTYANAADVQSGREWLRRASTQPAPDATYVRHMVRIFDSLKLYKDAQDLLERSAADNRDPQVARMLLQRTWQNGQLNAVIDRTKELDPTSADATLLAYRALALFESGKTDDAGQLIAAMGKRSADTEAIAWSTALGSRFAMADPRSALTQYQTALSRMPDNAVFRCLVGEAYARLGEMDLAITAWRRAAELAPSWARPRSYAARALASSNRLKEALEEANAAYSAMPDTNGAILMTSIGYKALEQGVVSASAEPNLLANVQRLQKEHPGEPETLPAYVNLLARAGRRDEAIAAARGPLKDPKKYDQAIILRLLASSRAHKLGLDDEFQRAATAAGSEGQDTPRLALTRAADLAASGKPLDGLALLEARAKSPATQPAQWQLALIQYKELIHDSHVADEWIALGNANPDDLAIQTAILKNAISVRGDREFVSKTIDRLKTLTGPEGQTWKLERARWLIGGGSTKDAADAVNTLSEIIRLSPSLTEARLLLAEAHEAVGNIPAATKELQEAANQDPNNNKTIIELARLLQEQSRFADARTYLERGAKVPDLSPESRWRIAGMLGAQGDAARAIAVLEAGKPRLDTAGQLLLADLYRRQQRYAEAEAIYTKLLSAQPVALDVVRQAADFYATRHQRQQAEKIMARLSQLELKPGMAELASAEFTERHVGADAARSFYLSATVAAPNNATAWRQWVAYHLRGVRLDQAKQAADDGLKNLPDDAVLQRLRSVAVSAAQILSSHGSMQNLISLLVTAAPADNAASEFFTGWPESSAQSGDAVPARLKDLAAHHPQSLALQTALVHWYVSQKQFDEAGKVAARTMDLFPTDPSSARAAAMLYRDAAQWDLAAAAIAKWRTRIGDDPMPADIMLAQVRLAQSDPSAALKVLTPYASALTSSPAGNPVGVETLLRAQAATGNEAGARALLSPLLAKDRIWRSIWITIAGNDLRNSETASAWLREVAALVPADSPADSVEQKLELAQGWYTLSTRTRAEGALEQASALLEPIVQKSDAPAAAILLRGSVADRAGDHKLAEECYRRGLVLNPDRPEALNNLAYLILLRDGDVKEAQQLASRAVELSPHAASYYDTLARVQIKLGQRETALGTFEQALKLEPGNLDALIGMATALCDAGKRNSAAGLLAQIDGLVKNKPPISPQLRRELEALRTTIKASL